MMSTSRGDTIDRRQRRARRKKSLNIVQIDSLKVLLAGPRADADMRQQCDPPVVLQVLIHTRLDGVYI